MNEEIHAIKALLVEDNPGDITLIQTWIEEDTFRPVVLETVKTLAEALNRMRGNTYDILLLDLGLPDSSGIQTFLATKAANPELPVIVLTGNNDIALATQCIELGAQDFLVKGYVQGFISHAIHNAVGRAALSRALAVSYDNFRQSVANFKDATVILDTSKRILFSNKAAVALLGRNAETGIEFYLPNEAVREEKEIMASDGKTIFAEISSGVTEWYGKPATILVIRDNTEKRNAERERDTLSSRLTHYLSTSPTLTYSLVLENGTTRWLWVSENISRILGYKSEEALAPDWWFNNIHPNDRSAVLGSIRELGQKGDAVREYRFLRKDRSIIWLRDEMRLEQGIEHDMEIVGTLTDISLRKEAEEELHLKSEALEAAANTIVITDNQGTIRWVNSAFETLTGFTPTETFGKNPRDLVKSGKETAETYRTLWNSILSGKVWKGEIVNKKKSGDFYTEEMTITPVLDSANRITNFIAIKSDITERKQAENRIQILLAEKDSLLKEVHQRIKNNMTTVAGLLSMQISAEQNQSAAESLRDAESRVRSIMMLYGRLYCTDNFRELSIKDYIQPLIDEIIAYFPCDGTISSVMFIDDFICNVGILSPLGIIINELITNMLKHAFVGRKKGIIIFTATLQNEHVVIILQVDGVGMPENISFENATGFGMQMVRMLLEQIGGHIEIVRGEGTKFILEFDRYTQIYQHDSKMSAHTALKE